LVTERSADDQCGVTTGQRLGDEPGTFCEARNATPLTQQAVGRGLGRLRRRQQPHVGDGVRGAQHPAAPVDDLGEGAQRPQELLRGHAIQRVRSLAPEHDADGVRTGTQVAVDRRVQGALEAQEHQPENDRERQRQEQGPGEGQANAQRQPPDAGPERGHCGAWSR
jgi:hypothetical protein